MPNKSPQSFEILVVISKLNLKNLRSSKLWRLEKVTRKFFKKSCQPIKTSLLKKVKFVGQLSCVPVSENRHSWCVKKSEYLAVVTGCLVAGLGGDVPS